MTKIIDGKKISNKILEELKSKTQNLKQKPGLAVILAGDNPSSKIYVASKEKCALDLGFKSFVYRFDESITQTQLKKLINELNINENIDGILVQLPLYKHLNEQELLEFITPNKDVDGFHPINVGKLNCGLKPHAICCTPKGIIHLLKEYKIKIEGKNVVIVGRSNIVGKPLASLFTLENATVTLAHSKTKNLKEITKTADILVSAVGKPNIIKADMVKKKAIVIDVGINKQPSGKVIGDVDFDKIKNIAEYITPVPGGVGPMTIAMLMENTYELFLEHNKQ